MNDMVNKEISNRNLLKLEELIFLSECDKIKKIEIPPNRIKENNIIKENIEKNLKLINKKIDLNEIKTNKDIKNNKINGGITNISTSTNNNKNKNSNGNTLNGISTNTTDKIEEITTVNKSLSENRNQSHIDINNININKKSNERKTIYNKNNSKNRNIETIIPALSLKTLLNKNNIKLNEEENNKYNYINDKNNKLRVRIRVNRNNKITIDRYIEKNNDLNPFHDSYNNSINEYKKYDNNSYNYLDKKNFENLLYSYNLNKAKNLNLLYDSDDDSIDMNNDLKQFSNSYKQFLKLKRAHPNN